MTSHTSIRGSLAGILFIIVAFLGYSPTVHAAEDCSFTRTLKEGSRGEDVRCLQEYLNTNGFVIATSGAGSPGNETDQFGKLTAKTLMSWQLANGLDTDGLFGPSSQAMYATLIGTSTSNSPVASNSDNPLVNATTQELTKILELLQEKAGTGTTTTPSPTSSSSEEKNTRKLLSDALDELDEAYDVLDEAREDDMDVDDAEENYQEAIENMFDAMRLFLDGDFAKAGFEAEDAIDSAQESYEDLEGNEEEDAEDALDDAEDALDDADEKIDLADDEGKDVDEAEELLEEAEEAWEEAEEAFDEGDYDDAIELAEEAEELADDAVKAID